jgi:hypothetical protein
MPHKLMRERTAYTGDQEIPNRMLEDRPVSHLKNVIDVGAVATWPRLGEAHVTDAACYFDEGLTGNIRIRLPGDTVVCQKTINFCLMAFLATNEVDLGVPEDPHRINRIHSRLSWRTAKAGGWNQPK